MAISFLPGEPNSLVNAIDCALWDGRRLVAYCSGNNLIILLDASVLLQTVYLPTDGTAVAINPATGQIAVAFGYYTKVIRPVVIYNRPLEWVEEDFILEDIARSNITCLSWGNSIDSPELLTASDSLILWSLGGESQFKNDEGGSIITSTSTSLFTPHIIWKKRLANSANIVAFSVDSWLVASVGEYDKLVKVWKRASFDIENVDFDFNYLPHPARVLNMRWKQPFDISQSIENTLYTFADDRVIRIWSPFDTMDPGNLQLWASIDLQGDHFGFILDNRDVSRAIENAVSSASNDDDLSSVISLGQRGAPEICLTFNKDSQRMSAYTIENVGLKKQKLSKVTRVVSNEKVIISKEGVFPFSSNRLDFFAYAHGVNSGIGTHSTSSRTVSRVPSPSPSTKNDISNSPTNIPSSSFPGLSILVHDYRGTLFNFSIDLPELLNPLPGRPRKWLLNSILTGHNKSVQRITRSADGNLLFSQSRFSENALWRPYVLPSGVTLKKCSNIEPKTGKVIRSVISANDDFVITLLDNQQLVLWDCHYEMAESIAADKVEFDYDPLCMFLLPESKPNDMHLVIVYDDKHVDSWSVKIHRSIEPPLVNGSLKYLGNFGLPIEQDRVGKLHQAVPVDPVGWDVTIGNSLDTFQREVLVTVSTDGEVTGWTARITSNHELEWLETSKVLTGEKNILRAQVSSTKKIVIANSVGTELSIWDTSNDLLEYKEKFPADNSISDLDWSTTPDNQCVLGVGFAKQVVLYCQQRFDYTNKTPSWAPFRRVDISQYTSHRIGDSIWLKDGTFVVGAGNQLFIQDRDADINDETTRHLLGSRYTRATLDNISTIFDICSVLNGPLPLYHPQLLIQSVFADKLDLVKYILCVLVKRLKFATISEQSVADISSNLGLDPGELFIYGSNNSDNNYEKFDSKVCEDLMEWLQKVSLPYLTRHQQITLASVIEALAYVDEQSRSLDANGIKYLLGFKLYKIHRGIQESMTTRDFNWALHSESQNLLIDMIQKSTSSPSKLSSGGGLGRVSVSSLGDGNKVTGILWPAIREVGVPFWLRNHALKELFEVLGRNYFSVGRDPINCTLYYLALRRKQILIGLWRTASWHKEQQKTIKILSNDFTQDRWRSAALKNAFALLGKHRYEYAAAFFLLGDSLKDAINVLVRNVNDLALAIAVARVYEGDDGPELKNLIHRHVIPDAEANGDRWLMSWALWMLKDRRASINALAWGAASTAVSHNTSPTTNGNRSMSFLVDDPVLIVLYRYLQTRERSRSHTQLTPAVSRLSSPLMRAVGAGTRSPQPIGNGSYSNIHGDEFRFVLKTAYIYSRMGCDLLALDLVRGWKFVHINARDVEHGLSSSSSISEPSEDLFNTVTGAMMNKSTIPRPLIEKENHQQNEKLLKNLKPVDAVAFQEPDMSSFDFGF